GDARRARRRRQRARPRLHDRGARTALDGGRLPRLARVLSPRRRALGRARRLGRREHLHLARRRRLPLPPPLVGVSAVPRLTRRGGAWSVRFHPPPAPPPRAAGA